MCIGDGTVRVVLVTESCLSLAECKILEYEFPVELVGPS
jgi:hypothetical protein